jgi:DNA-binding IclR family transcriptional regulator
VRSSDGDSVVSRVFRLLDAFDDGTPERTLDELLLASDLPRSTAHRLCQQLVERGALERSRRGWRLGTRMFELGQAVSLPRRLRDIALPHMQDLFAATGETVQLAVVDAAQVLYVEIIAGHRRVPTPSRRGGRMPMHCTALGKTLLAFSADAGREFLSAGPALKRRTPQTIVDAEHLRLEINDVRRSQLAYDLEESAMGLICVAGPVLGVDGTATVALSVSMPARGRLTLAEAAAATRMAARALSREALHSPRLQ